MKCHILFSTHFARIHVYFPRLIPYQLKLLGSPFLVRKWHSLLTLLLSISPSFSSSDSFEDLHVFEVENLVTFVCSFCYQWFWNRFGLTWSFIHLIHRLWSKVEPNFRKSFHRKFRRESCYFTKPICYYLFTWTFETYLHTNRHFSRL